MKLEKILQRVEEFEWSYDIYDSYVELNRFSPLGEDFGMCIDFNRTDKTKSFLENLREYAYNFDVDEHVEMWLPSRGKGGCPSSIAELVEDAVAIKEMIEELYEELAREVEE